MDYYGLSLLIASLLAGQNYSRLFCLKNVMLKSVTKMFTAICSFSFFKLLIMFKSLTMKYL